MIFFSGAYNAKTGMMYLPTRISKITGPRGVSKMRGFPPVAFKVDLQGSQLWVDTKFLVEPWYFTVFLGSTGQFQEKVFFETIASIDHNLFFIQDTPQLFTSGS